MGFAVFMVGVIEVMVGFMGIAMFVSECERWPSQYRCWTPFTQGTGGRHGNTGEIRVGIRRKSERVFLTTLDVAAPSFDDRLAEAQSQARERCIQLNAADRHLRRRLPR